MFARTFHPDEANQALTTGRLLETGFYAYSPTDHHGPTLYYAAAALQKAAGHGTTASLDGDLLRATPLVFAVLLLVLGFVSLRKLTGRCLPAILFALLLGTAPIFVFFATDFIQEMLLAAFTMGMCCAAVYRQPWWFGLATGLAFATKETSSLAFLAAGGAWLVTLRARPNLNKCILAILVAGLAAVTLFSSFCTYWPGVYNAFIAAPLAYLGRAAGQTAASAGAAWHVHPWWQHLAWLFGSGRFGEVPLLLMSLSTLLVKREDPLVRPARFFGLYTLILLAFYSLIPYKTPWCGLQIAVPLAVTAALGGLSLASNRSKVSCLAAVILVGACLVEHVSALNILFATPDAKTIPYNYASADPEVRETARFVSEALERDKTGESFAAVAVPAEDTWPLPWYLRRYADRVGYWTSFNALERLASEGAKPAAVVVPMSEGHLVQPLFPALKETKRFYIRSGVRLRMFR